jgi:hypothetical protein
MESENIFNSLAIDSFADQDLVIAVVNFFAAHNTDILQVLAFVGEFPQSLGRDIRSSNINVLEEFELCCDKLGACIVDFSAAEEVELIDIFEFFKLCDAIICDVTAFSQ